MATVMPARRRRPESFQADADSFPIHEDAPSTEDTEMNESAVQDEEADPDADLLEEEEEEEDEESDYSKSSDDEVPDSSNVQQDMERLQNCFAGFRQKYRLIKRIGEGSHSSVFQLHVGCL
jgi:cell division control protein 7